MRTEERSIETTSPEDRYVFDEEDEPSDPIGDEVVGLREELASERDLYLRLAAEFDNYRRRVRKDRAEAAENGKRELVTQLITIADDFDRSLEHLDEKSGQVAEGIQAIRRRFSDMLFINGVEPFESQGEKFDPERHEAFDVVTPGKEEPGTVQTEIRRGYFWNGKLLRPALVVVAM